MEMTPLLAGLLPALGGIGIWFVWRLAKGHIETREEGRRQQLDAKREREIDRLA